MTATAFDVVIVGAGMVGGACAAALADSGLRVAVLEPSITPPVASSDPVGTRVSALSRASGRILERVGAWPRIASVRISPYRAMRVWDATGDGAVTFDAADLGEPELGHIVENALVQHALWATLQASGRVELFAPATLAGLAFHPDHARLTLADGRTLHARLVVGADGANSQVRRLADIAVESGSYEQQGLVAHLRPARSHQATAWQRFMPDGPLALLPLADGRVSIVWSTTPEHAAQLLAFDDTAFGAAVTAGSDAVLGELRAESARAAFPLRHLHAAHYVQPRLALIGDAAHVVHPLAGQGVNLGLLDAAVLAEVLGAAHAAGDDPGDLAVLRRYERWRRGDNAAMLAAFGGFKDLFGSAAAPVRLARNLGLGLFDRLGPVKREVARRAMGLAGDLPALARA
jgi:2-octaprenylphenol hydroxylase